MTLKLLVAIAAIVQVVGAAYLSIGTFETNERILSVFIQPAGWAFSIWGLIYTLSFVYAGYQLLSDNELVQATRVPALTAFLGSTAWLYFAGADGVLVWLTIPILFIIALTLTAVVRLPDGSDEKTNVLSKRVLYPYAAWTGIACWLNVQTLLVDQQVVTAEAVNITLNAVLFGAIALYALWFFRKSGYSLWYGGVLAWASVGIIATNQFAGVGLWFSVAAAVLIGIVCLKYIQSFKLS